MNTTNQVESPSIFKVGITLIPGIGDKTIKQLVSYCGSAEAVFKETKGKLLKIPGIGTKATDALASSSVFKEAEAIINRVVKEGTQLLFFTDQHYPDRLKVIDDSPCLLHYNGSADLNNSKIISIVGTRRATLYGQEITRQLVEDLAPHNPIIISGLAYGIDIAAHKAALDFGLETIGVMASGLNIIYPNVHIKQATQMLTQGGLLTEFNFDAPPDRHNFPSRNRIIAGMSDATIVIEAAQKGGALITADIAHSYNKEVFAVPGEINKIYSQGCNALIKNHKAQLITSAKDIERELHWGSTTIRERKKQLQDLNLNEQELKLVHVLSETPVTLDEIARKAQLPIGQLSSDLLTLEFRGVVKSLPGNRYSLNY